MNPLPEPWSTIIQAGGTAGLVGVLLFILWLFVTKKIVPGSLLEEATARHRAEEDRLNAELSAERAAGKQLGERTAAMLTETSQALKDAARGYGYVVERNDQPQPATQLDVATRRAELLADSMERTLRQVEQMVKEQGKDG